MEWAFLIIIDVFKFLKKQGIGKHQFTVNKVLQTWVAVNYNKVIRCSFCEDECVAVGFCKDCAKLIDEQCVYFHKKIIDLQDHQIIDFRTESRRLSVSEAAPRQFCLHSRQKRLERTYYCTDCCILICDECLKRHTTKNHYVNSVYHLYDLLDCIHDTKRLIEDILTRSSANLNPKDRMILTTIITYTDISLGITNDYKDIGDAPVPPEIQDLLEREMTPDHETYLKCEAVIDKVKEMQRDLRLPFMDYRPDCITDDISDIFDCTYPKHIVDDTTDEQLGGDLSSQCSFSTDSSYVTCEDIEEYVPSTGFGPITVASYSCTTDDLFPSLQKPENENNAAKTIEQDIVQLQQARQNQINMDSFNDIHQ